VALRIRTVVVHGLLVEHGGGRGQTHPALRQFLQHAEAFALAVRERDRILLVHLKFIFKV
jgi:hypothetical protein